MNVLVKIYYTNDEYNPALYFCNFDAAWQLWWTLTHAYERGVSGPHVNKVEIWDGNTQMDMTKSIAENICRTSQQYKL